MKYRVQPKHHTYQSGRRRTFWYPQFKTFIFWKDFFKKYPFHEDKHFFNTKEEAEAFITEQKRSTIKTIKNIPYWGKNL